MSSDFDIAKQRVVKACGSEAGQLYEMVSAFDRPLGRYLMCSMLQLPLPSGVNLRRRHAMRLGALASQGNSGRLLDQEIELGLDAGLGAAEIVEVIIHTVPYVGIPKALNSLLASKATFERHGLLPVELAAPKWTSEQRMDVGLDKIAFAHPHAAPILEANLAPVAADLYAYIVGSAFADIYGRPGLKYVQRQPITVVSLATQGDVQNFLSTHLNGALNIGLLPKTIMAALVDILPLVETSRVLESVETALTVFADRDLAVSTEPSVQQEW